MIAHRAHRRVSGVWFVLTLLAVYATAVAMVAAGALAGRPAVATALTLDLTVVVPGLFYLLVVRATSLPGSTVLPVFLFSLLGASAVLPDEHDSTLYLLAMLAAPAEVLLGGYVGVRAYRAWRADRARGAERRDLLERFGSAFHALVPVPVVARAAAHEVAVVYYALLSWRSRPDVAPGELGFTYHRRNGYVGLLLAVALAGVVETVAVHLLVGRWSAIAAWVLTVVSVYGVLWLLGLAQAVRLRPVLLTPDALHVRIGLLWNVRVPYGRIASLRPAEGGDPDGSTAGYLHAVPAGRTQLVLELRQPVEALGLYGYVKRGIRRIGISVDQRDRFSAELARRVAAAGGEPALPPGPTPHRP